MVAAPTLHIVGKPNYAQFGNQVHADRVDVRAEADHANGADNLLMGRGGLERRDKPGGLVSSADRTARAKTGGRGTSSGKADCGDGQDLSSLEYAIIFYLLIRPTHFLVDNMEYFFYA